jgi:ribulose 1,5-bisphosphate carboxylase large subunit-like protein
VPRHREQYAHAEYRRTTRNSNPRTEDNNVDEDGGSAMFVETARAVESTKRRSLSMKTPQIWQKTESDRTEKSLVKVNASPEFDKNQHNFLCEIGFPITTINDQSITEMLITSILVVFPLKQASRNIGSDLPDRRRMMIFSVRVFHSNQPIAEQMRSCFDYSEG